MSEIIEELVELVTNNNGQMTYEEYAVIYHILKQNAPCNMLIFGMGNDSSVWTALNQAGYTLFIEDNEEWISAMKPRLSGNFEIVLYSFETTIDAWMEYLQHSALLDSLKMNFNPKTLHNRIYTTPWDIVLIDGPAGYGPATPGRMMPVSTSASLHKKQLLIHDCHRIVENVYSRIFLGNQFEVINTLRYYKW